jgi:hypothetical protein
MVKERFHTTSLLVPVLSQSSHHFPLRKKQYQESFELSEERDRIKRHNNFLLWTEAVQDNLGGQRAEQDMFFFSQQAD